MKGCEYITVPTLVIQSKKDPIVNPASGKIIFNKIASKNKELFEPDIEKHTITTGKDKELIFNKIADFINKLESY